MSGEDKHCLADMLRAAGHPPPSTLSFKFPVNTLHIPCLYPDIPCIASRYPLYILYMPFIYHIHHTCRWVTLHNPKPFGLSTLHVPFMYPSYTLYTLCTHYIPCTFIPCLLHVPITYHFVYPVYSPYLTPGGAPSPPFPNKNPHAGGLFYHA